MRRPVLSVALVLALAAGTVATTGCFGRYALTKSLHGWNKGLGNRFIQTLIMWGLIIIPVYEVALLADLFIFNTVEFWSGSNPVAGADPKPRVLADGSVEIERAGKVYRLVPTGAASFDLVHEGVCVGHGHATPDGGLSFTHEATGQTVVLTAEDLARFEARMGALQVAQAE